MNLEPRRSREFTRKKFLKKLESGLEERKRILSKISEVKSVVGRIRKKEGFSEKELLEFKILMEKHMSKIAR